MRKDNFAFKEKIVEGLNLPKDLLLSGAVITLTGSSEVKIINYKGILEYETDRIRIDTSDGRVNIIGKALTIAYYSADEMKILGRITDISYGA